MKLSDFKKAGHWPTLLAAFLYFDISFMAWVSLGPLMIYITKGMPISVEDKLSLVAIPVLGGAFFRVPLGLLADAIGPKMTGILAQAIVMFAVSLVCVFGLSSSIAIALFGLSLGVAGASFAVALPQAGRWYPPQYQGLVMGIAGAGNMGVVLDTLFAPSIAEAYGWQAVYGVLLALMVLVLLIYSLAAKDAPGGKTTIALGDYGRMLADSDSRWFMFFYFITFGGFVGLASALPLYFTTQYHATGVAAGLMVALIVAFGSGFRPVGGYIADRIGGVKTLCFLFVLVSACYFAVAFLPAGPAPAKGVAGWGLTAAAARRLCSGGAVLCRRVIARHGQWRGVSVAAAAVPPGDRRDDGPRRRRGWVWRIFSRQDARLLQRSDGRLHRRVRLLRFPCAARSRRFDLREDALADDLGRRFRRANLS